MGSIKVESPPHDMEILKSDSTTSAAET